MMMVVEAMDDGGDSGGFCYGGAVMVVGMVERESEIALKGQTCCFFF